MSCTSKVCPVEPEASDQGKVGPWPTHFDDFGSEQRVLGSDEDSSSDESYIGQSNILASSSSEEDHDPVVFAPLEVGDPSAGLARATSGHSDIDENLLINGACMSVDDARMDPLAQKALKSRNQRRKRSNILRARI